MIVRGHEAAIFDSPGVPEVCVSGRPLHPPDPPGHDSTAEVYRRFRARRQYRRPACMQHGGNARVKEGLRQLSDSPTIRNSPSCHGLHSLYAPGARALCHPPKVDNSQSPPAFSWDLPQSPEAQVFRPGRRGHASIMGHRLSMVLSGSAASA